MFLIKGFNYVFGKWLFSHNAHLNYSLKYSQRKRGIDINYLDYIRLATLELVANEIHKKNLPGNVAEVGVYKGKFAKYINQYFPSKRLYLFDTFEGFDKKDVQTEKKLGFNDATQDFSNTSVDLVLKNMPFPKQCVIKKGFFPETTAGIEDSFVFVSLDTDLYEPIYQGLIYFYPRMVKGGYIFVHDVNNESYKGAAKAVDEFSSQQGISFLPIPDSCGSVVFIKN
ncbi:MAG TPA: TylF/MycF/NovP-related O-methyltransferase [Hanamia sp.]|nr:TylF/MycF/NovP-related O-methyltransferase [Hanamia sp.]